MKKLILLDYPCESDIKIKINCFPDGQKSVTIEEESIPLLYKKGEFVIVCSIDSFDKLGLIRSCVSALNKHTKEYSLYAPYIMGARSDRKFELGGDMYLDDVILPILNQCEFKKIYALDFHCDRSNIYSIKNDKYFDFNDKDVDTVFVFPDKSAFNRYKNILHTNVCFLNGNVKLHNHAYCEKTRNNDGSITQNIVTNNDISKFKKYIIIDDLFDGGRSYIGLIEKILEENSDANIKIYTTHMIGSNKDSLIRLLCLGIELITTNSYTPFMYKYINVRTYESNMLPNVKMIDILFNKENINKILENCI
ncbi:MAG: hypothetical protein RSE41_04725 [Clostridia bacterium]